MWLLEISEDEKWLALRLPSLFSEIHKGERILSLLRQTLQLMLAYRKPAPNTLKLQQNFCREIINPNLKTAQSLVHRQ